MKQRERKAIMFDRLTAAIRLATRAREKLMLERQMVDVLASLEGIDEILRVVSLHAEILQEEGQ